MELNTILTLIGIILGLAGPTIAVLIFLMNALQRLAKVEECVDPKSAKEDGERLARLETKVDYMLGWIAALNGEMREGKDFEKLLDKIKEVAKEKGL
jgi:hypothetical protein